VRHVRQHLVLAGEVHQEAVVPYQSVGVALGGQPRVHVADHHRRGQIGVVVFDDEVERAVHSGVGLPHFEAGLVAERGVARGVYVPLRGHAHRAESRGELDVVDAPIRHGHAGEHGPDDRSDARLLNLAFDPAAQPDFVVEEGDGAGGGVPPVHRAFGGEVRDHAVGDAVGDLIRPLAVRVEADDGADDGADGLTAERRRRVHDDDAPPERRRFERRRHARHPGAYDADVRFDGGDRPFRGPAEDAEHP
jgi:hypothetical protein